LALLLVRKKCEEGSSIKNIGRFDFHKEQKRNDYSINHGVERNTAPIVSFFQLAVGFRTKFGNTEVSCKFSRKKAHENVAPFRRLLGLILYAS